MRARALLPTKAQLFPTGLSVLTLYCFPLAALFAAEIFLIRAKLPFRSRNKGICGRASARLNNCWDTRSSTFLQYLALQAASNNSLAIGLTATKNQASRIKNQESRIKNFSRPKQPFNRSSLQILQCSPFHLIFYLSLT
jgi:hypothetical protein